MAKPKTAAEEFETAQRQAEDVLAAEPVPASPYLTGSLEEDEQREDEQEKTLATELNQESDKNERTRIIRLEEAFTEQAALLREICKAIGGVKNPTGYSAPEDVPAPPSHLNPTIENPMRPVKFILIPTDNPHENRPQPVNLNGNQWIIPRGEIVTAPWAIMEILRTAVIDSYEYPIEGGRYLGVKHSQEPLVLSEPVYRPVRRFNLQILEG